MFFGKGAIVCWFFGNSLLLYLYPLLKKENLLVVRKYKVFFVLVFSIVVLVGFAMWYAGVCLDLCIT